MNDDYERTSQDIQQLERGLEWATASTAAPESDMDPRTAALREAWTVWGSLLETAETPMEPLLVRRITAPAHRRGWLTVGAGLAAALVAIAAATVWFALTARGTGTSIRWPQTMASADPQPQTSAVAIQQESNASASQSVSAGAEVAWDDTVDDDIAQVGEKLIEVQQDWHARTDAFALVWCQLEQIGSEVEAGSL